LGVLFVVFTFQDCFLDEDCALDCRQFEYLQKTKTYFLFFFTEKKVKFFLKLLKKVIFKVLKKNLTAKKKRGMNRFMKKWWCKPVAGLG